MKFPSLFSFLVFCFTYMFFTPIFLISAPFVLKKKCCWKLEICQLVLVWLFSPYLSKSVVGLNSTSQHSPIWLEYSPLQWESRKERITPYFCVNSSLALPLKKGDILKNIVVIVFWTLIFAIGVEMFFPISQTILSFHHSFSSLIQSGWI